jgi:hypothetical protein
MFWGLPVVAQSTNDGLYSKEEIATNLRRMHLDGKGNQKVNIEPDVILSMDQEIIHTDQKQ